MENSSAPVVASLVPATRKRVGPAEPEYVRRVVYSARQITTDPRTGSLIDRVVSIPGKRRSVEADDHADASGNTLRRTLIAVM